MVNSQLTVIYFSSVNFMEQLVIPIFEFIERVREIDIFISMAIASRSQVEF